MSNAVTVITPAAVARPLIGEVLGVPVGCMTSSETVAFIEGLVKAKQVSQICTADACGVALAQKLPELKKIYQQAALVTCDSIGVNWALARQGIKHERVCGVDLMEELCRTAAVSGLRIYFVGGRPGVANEAAEGLRAKYPGCEIVGVRHGFFGPSAMQAVIDEIQSLGVDLVFVGMGIPKQELLAFKLVEQKAVTVAMGVGGSFDVLSGRLRRAPGFVQQMGMEWLWRALLDPRKVKKLVLLPGFVFRVLREPRRTYAV